MTEIAGAPDISEIKRLAADEIAGRRESLLALSHHLHANPEVSWQEHDAAARTGELLAAAGFEVEVGAYGLPTAIEAVTGTGDLTVAICAEYDALPGIGHACGHNVIAAAGVGAALGLSAVADRAGLRVKLLGTPAEEHGGGKVAMLAAGAWEDVDFSLMVHGRAGADLPAGNVHTTAAERFEVEFLGRAAHAAAVPERGLNAGAAATLALTAIGLLRQQLPKEVNLNAFVSVGGQATNIIPDRAVLQVEVRAYDLDVWREAKRALLACFEGAAIALGCRWRWSATEHAYAPLQQDPVLASFWDRNMVERGRELTGVEVGGGSTDMGNVSQVVPSLHPSIAFRGQSAPGHSVAFAEAARTPAADEAAIDGAVLLAWTTLDAALDPQVRTDLRQRTAARPAGSTRVVLTA